MDKIAMLQRLVTRYGAWVRSGQTRADAMNSPPRQS